MEIVVVVKPLPEPEARIRASADGARFDVDGVKFVLAGYDESAVEQALLLKEAHPPSSVRVVAYGPPARCEEVLRAALALGCDRATCVEAGEAAPFDDPLRAARGVASALSGQPLDLVLVGKQALDDEEGLFGAALAELLTLGFVGHVRDLRLEAAQFTFRRSVESGEERWQAPSPCVIALQQAWNDPRTAKLPAILKSRKTPIERVAPIAETDSVPVGSIVRFALPAPRTGARLIEYKTPQEAAEKLVRLLREEAKVFP